LFLAECWAVGVGSRGNDIEAFSPVRRSDIGRSKTSPLRIEPETGKVSEDFGEPEAEMSPYVFQHDESWS
jgi:hypothetical protein